MTSYKFQDTTHATVCADFSQSLSEISLLPYLVDVGGLLDCEKRRSPASNVCSEIQRLHADMQKGQDAEHGNCVDAMESADKPWGWTQVVQVRQVAGYRHGSQVNMMSNVLQCYMSNRTLQMGNALNRLPYHDLYSMYSMSCVTAVVNIQMQRLPSSAEQALY